MGLFDGAQRAYEDMKFDVRSAGTLGRVQIPGDSRIELPAGAVRVTFLEPPGETKWFIGSTPKAPKLPGLVVRREADAEPLALRRFGGANFARNRGGAAGLVGTLDIPEAGSYLISCPEPFHTRWHYVRMPTASAGTALLFDLRGDG